MSKLLLFILLLVGIYYWRRSVLRDDRDEGSRKPMSSAEPPRIETMLACAQCDLLVPRSEGVESGGHFYCCAEHARLGRKAPQA